MRLLIFLMLGTLIFGFAFPMFIVAIAFFLIILAVISIVGLLTGAFGGKHVIIYKNGRSADSFGKRSNDRHAADAPEVMPNPDYTENMDVYDFGEQAEAEIVELPPSALSKEKDEE